MQVIQVAPIQVGIWTVQIIDPLLGKWTRSGCASYSAELSALGRQTDPVNGPNGSLERIVPSPHARAEVYMELYLDET